jgi:hypothetical protein
VSPGVSGEQPTEQPLPAGGEPAVTGVPEIDAAIARLSQLSQIPLDRHHDQLASAHEVLNAALNPERSQDVPA